MSHRYGFWHESTVEAPEANCSSRISTTVWLTWYNPFIEHPTYAIVPIALYAAVLILSGLSNWRNGVRHLIGVPFALLLLHIGFTIGLVDGLFRKGGASQDR